MADKVIGLQKEKVELAPYNLEWEKSYKNEEKLLHDLFGKYAIEIQHIGSTAIPGAKAKPIIDIAVGVENLEETENYLESLKQLGYKLEHCAEKGRYFFAKERAGKITQHLHIEKIGSDVWDRQIIFINYLKKNKDALDRYNKFKTELAEKYKDDRKSYVAAKVEFIDNLIVEAEDLAGI